MRLSGLTPGAVVLVAPVSARRVPCSPGAASHTWGRGRLPVDFCSQPLTLRPPPHLFYPPDEELVQWLVKNHKAGAVRQGLLWPQRGGGFGGRTAPHTP